MFNAVGGLWPLLHMRSFEQVLGPKTDRWLVRTVAGLMLASGLAQVLPSPVRLACAWHVGPAWVPP